MGIPIDEQIDTFSMGNNIYVVLTGLWPFYEDKPYSAVQRKILQEERPYIDDRYREGSYIEHKLVEIMERMWEFKPQDRPSIFEVVEFLHHVRHVVETTLARHKERLQVGE